MKILKEQTALLPEEIFYHATFKYRVNSIKKYGLGAKPRRVWDISEAGYTYFVNDGEVAVSFCESADDVSEGVYDSGIVLFSITGKSLSEFAMENDNNMQVYPDETNSNGEPLKYIKVKGIIPFEYLKYEGFTET